MVVSITLLKHVPPNSTDVISSRILSFVFFFVSSLHLDLKVFIGEFHHWWNLLKYKAWSEYVEPAEVVEHTALLFARMSKREKDYNVFKANSRTCLIDWNTASIFKISSSQVCFAGFESNIYL